MIGSSVRPKTVKDRSASRFSQEDVPKPDGARPVATTVDEETGQTLDLWWVPYGEGWEVPAFINYTSGDGPFDWEILVGIIEGRPQCLQFECWMTGGVPISAEMLHSLPLGRLVEEAVLMSSRPADEVPHRLIRWENEEALRRERAAVAKRFRGQRRKRLSKAEANRDRLGLLREVADIYRRHENDPKASLRTWEVLNEAGRPYSREYVRRLIFDARSEGLLPAAKSRAPSRRQPKENSDGVSAS